MAKSRVDITLCQHGKFPATLLLMFFVLYYKRNIKHFSVLIYSYINTRENWKNSKLCENTPPCECRVSRQFLVFPISTRVYITVYQHGKCFIFLKYKTAIPTSYPGSFFGKDPGISWSCDAQNLGNNTNNRLGWCSGDAIVILCEEWKN